MAKNKFLFFLLHLIKLKIVKLNKTISTYSISADILYLAFRMYIIMPFECQNSLPLRFKDLLVCFKVWIMIFQLEPDVSLEYAMTKYFAMKASKVICDQCADLMGNR